MRLPGLGQHPLTTPSPLCDAGLLARLSDMRERQKAKKRSTKLGKLQGSVDDAQEKLDKCGVLVAESKKVYKNAQQEEKELRRAWDDAIGAAAQTHTAAKKAKKQFQKKARPPTACAPARHCATCQPATRGLPCLDTRAQAHNT